METGINEKTYLAWKSERTLVTEGKQRRETLAREGPLKRGNFCESEGEKSPLEA